ncbi:MAG: ATP-binding protein [bacterium]
MFKKNIFLFFCFIFVNSNVFTLNRFDEWFGGHQDSPSYGNKYHLVNQPLPSKEISISGRNLSDLRDAIGKNLDAFTIELTELEKYIESVKREVQDSRGRGKDFSSCDGEIKGLETRLKVVKEKISYYETLRKSSVNGLVENQALKERLDLDLKKRNNEIDAYFAYFFKKENLVKTSSLAVATIGGSIASYYALRLGFGQIESIIGKPSLVRESNRLGIKKTLNNFWKYKILGNPVVDAKIEDVILSPDLKNILSDFAIDTKNTYFNRLPFRNVLFYGAPGTGKTMFAKRLAKFCNMDYAILSGADFSQFNGGQAIVELHKFFDWAQKSKNGLIVFIDESDSFLRDRKKLDNDATNLVNAFLSRTGESLDKIMFVFATNYPQELDPAVLSRIHKKILFPLPGFNERKEIIKLYIKKYIVDDQRVIKENGIKVLKRINFSDDINDIFINSLAQKADGLSARALEQMISEMRICAYNRGNGILTKDIADSVVMQKIKEFNQVALYK